MTVTPNPILDLDPGIGMIASTVEYDVVGRNLELLGTLRPLAADNITTNISGAIKRQLQGVIIGEQDARDLNPYSDRIKPYWVLEDGTRWPMGVFCFTDDVKTVGSYVSTYATTLMDQDFVLDQAVGSTFTVPQNGSIIKAMTQILDQSGILQRTLPQQDAAVVGTPPVWPAETSKLAILNALSKLGGWLPPYFDNDGFLVVRYPPNIDLLSPDCKYADNRRIIRGTIIEDDNLLNAPNVYQVVDSSPTSGPIIARAGIDPLLPWSVQNRGFEIVNTIRAQGLANTAAAQNMANQAAAAAGVGYKNVSFNALPDPRHDLFMVVQYGSTMYREISWQLGLHVGGPHSHKLTLGGFPSAG